MPVDHLIFFGKKSVEVLCPFLKPYFFSVCLFDVELCYIHPLSDVYFANVFFHSVGALHFVDSFLCCTKGFSLIQPHLFISAFVSLA